MQKVKKYWWILAALVALIILTIGILSRAGVINSGIMGKSNQAQKNESPVSTPQKPTFRDKVIEHEGEIVALQNALEALRLRIDALEATCSNRTATNTSKSGVSKTSQPVSQSTSSPTEWNIAGQSNLANLDYLRQGGKILFCIMVNGLEDHYFPQFALDRRVTFTSTKSNLTKNGSNWEVEPTSNFEGDFGVTNGGILYVKASPVATVMQTNGEKVNKVDILTSYTKWKPTTMILRGDYWVFETKLP